MAIEFPSLPHNSHKVAAVRQVSKAFSKAVRLWFSQGKLCEHGAELGKQNYALGCHCTMSSTEVAANQQH